MMKRLLLIVGIASGAAPCVPFRNKAWVFGTLHKSGTVLFRMVLQETKTDLYFVNLYNKNFRNRPVPTSFQVTNFDDIPLRGTAFWDHVNFPNTETFAKLETWAHERGQELRTVIMIRDPLEMILSAYFYHLQTSEWWALTPMKNLTMFHHLTSPDVDVRSYRNVSYQEMLNDVDADKGVLIQAILALGEIKVMNTTVATVAQFPDVARVYDLAQVTASSEAFDAAFYDIFSFVGVANVSDCVTRAARHDLNRQRAPNPHVMAVDRVSERESLRDRLLTNPWFQDHIDPIRRYLHYST